MLSTNEKFKTIGISTLAHTLCEQLTSFKCTWCKLFFSDNKSFINHCRVHTLHAARQNHFCKYCKKLCPSTTYLQMHERTHIKEKLYPCEHCGRGFSQRGACVAHMRICKVAKKNVENNMQPVFMQPVIPR